MEINEKDIGLIEEFIDGNLSGKELKAFQDRLEHDADFAGLYKVRKKMAESMKEAGEYQRLKSQIGEVIRKERKTFYQEYKYYILPIAASVVIIIGLYIVFQFQADPGEKGPQLAETTDTISVMKMDEPEKLAKIKTLNYVDILAPVDKQQFGLDEPIHFIWNADSDQFGTLYVINVNDNIIVLEKNINFSDGSFEINKNQFPQGEYKWYLNDTINSGSFVVRK